MTYIHRKIEKQIILAAKTMPVIGIIGPRQSGKTTLAKNLFADFLYVNLEFPDHRLFAERDPRTFLSQSNKMIIDEAQQVPALFSYIQGFVDQDKKSKYILTGSSNFSLLEKISQSLAGRIALFTVLPFAISELPKDKLANSQAMQFTGFYPRVILENNNPVTWYQDYIQTYLERDVRQVTAFHMADQFYNFLKILATRTGSMVNYSELAKETGVSPNTARGWFSVLMASYIIYTVPPYFTNIKKRLVKAPKFYFYDTGIVCSLLGIRDQDILEGHILAGQIFENFIMSEIVKNEYINHRNIHNIFYYRDHGGLEVDILKEGVNQVDLFEIKRNKLYKKDFVDNMNTLVKLLSKNKKNNKIVQKNIIYGGNQTMQDADVSIVSWRDIN